MYNTRTIEQKIANFLDYELCLNNQMCLFNNTHHKGALHVANVFQLPQFVYMKIIIGIHTFGYHFQHKIKFAGYIVTLNYFGQFINGFNKARARFFIVLFQRYVADYHQAFSYFGVVNQSSVLQYNSSVFHPLDALVHRRSTQVYAGSYFTHSYFGILLQQF